MHYFSSIQYFCKIDFKSLWSISYEIKKKHSFQFIVQFLVFHFCFWQFIFDINHKQKLIVYKTLSMKSRPLQSKMKVKFAGGLCTFCTKSEKSVKMTLFISFHENKFARSNRITICHFFVKSTSTQIILTEKKFEKSWVISKKKFQRTKYCQTSSVSQLFLSYGQICVGVQQHIFLILHSIYLFLLVKKSSQLIR